jgi:methylase of polypeptide subunit release factors
MNRLLARMTPMSSRSMSFGPLNVRFDDDVLRPRPWTLLQSTWAADLAVDAPTGTVLELGCGAGHIGQAAIALMDHRRALVQVDVDPRACELARVNADANGLGDVVDARCGEIDDAGVLADGEAFGVVLVDPPYVPSEEAAALDGDPRQAVDGGEDGLELARRFLTVAVRHLEPGGAVLLQALGAAQVEALGPDVTAAGLVVVEVRSEDERRAVALLRQARS